jgi:hypothetical protein
MQRQRGCGFAVRDESRPADSKRSPTEMRAQKIARIGSDGMREAELAALGHGRRQPVFPTFGSVPRASRHVAGFGGGAAHQENGCQSSQQQTKSGKAVSHDQCTTRSPSITSPCFQSCMMLPMAWSDSTLMILILPSNWPSRLTNISPLTSTPWLLPMSSTTNS